MSEWNLDQAFFQEHILKSNSIFSGVPKDYENKFHNYTRRVIALYEQNSHLLKNIFMNDRLWRRIADQVQYLTDSKPNQKQIFLGTEIQENNIVYTIHGIYHGGPNSRLSKPAREILGKKIKAIADKKEPLVSEDNLLQMLGYSSDMEMGDHIVSRGVIRYFLSEYPILSWKELFKVLVAPLVERLFKIRNAQYCRAVNAMKRLEQRLNQDYLGYLPAYRLARASWPEVFQPNLIEYLTDFKDIIRSVYMAWFMRKIGKEICETNESRKFIIHAIVGLGHEKEISSCLQVPSQTPVTILKERFVTLEQLV